MKKILLVLAFLAMAALAKAQDVIITKDSERIEAQITEITDDEVKYKRFDNLDGPVFVLSGEKVASIVFANGEVFVFKSKKQSTGQGGAEQEFVVLPVIEDESIIIQLSTEREIVYRTGIQIEVENGKTYYGDFKFNKSKEYKEFLQQTCPGAYEEFKRSEKYGIAGSVPGWIAVGFMGYALYKEVEPLIDGRVYESDFGPWDLFKPMLLPMGISVGLLLVAIPLTNNSIKHATEARNIFNQNCALQQSKSKQVFLSIQITPIAAGLTINF